MCRRLVADTGRPPRERPIQKFPAIQMSSSHAIVRIRMVSALLQIADVEAKQFAAMVRRPKRRSVQSWARELEQTARLHALVRDGRRRLVEMALRE